MKILVNGASGFLGTNLISKAMESDDIRVLALTTNKHTISDAGGDGRIEYYSYDELSQMDHHGIDVFINLAYPRTASGEALGKGLKDIYESLKAISGWGIPKVINISSQSIYDPNRTCAAKESDEAVLNDVYAEGKFLYEMIMREMFRDAEVISIRLASLIGMGFDQRVTNKLVKIALKNNHLNITEKGAVFSYMDVRDAAEALLAMCRVFLTDKELGNVYNLGGKEDYTLSEIAAAVRDAIQEQTGAGITVDTVEDAAETVPNSSLNCEAFYKDFNWQPSKSLKDSINDILIYEKQRIDNA